MNRFSLKYQIAITIFLLQTILLGIAFWGMSRMLRDSMGKQAETKADSLLFFVDEASRAALIRGEYDELQWYVNRLAKDPAITRIRVSDRKNRIIVSTERAEVGNPMPATEMQTNRLEKSRDISNPSGTMGRIAITLSDVVWKRDYDRIRNAGILLSVLGVLISAGIGVLVGHILTRRLKMLDAVAQQISAGNYDVAVEVSGNDEIGRLGLVFQQMTDNVRSNIGTLQETTQRLQLATTSGGIGIWDWDIQSNVLTWDDRMFELYGISRDIFPSRVEGWEKNLHPEDYSAATEAIRAAIRGEKEFDTEFRVVHPDGTVKFLQANAVVIRDADGKAIRMIGINRDITERRSLEEQFRQSQKMEAVGRLAGGIAHDFNNLLTVSIGYCEMALNRIGEKDPLRRDLEEIRKASERCATLTRQLLAFSRKQILIPKVIDLNDVVADMDKMLRRLIGEDVELAYVSGADLWRVKADPGQVEQVIVNLVVNARDAMPRGGKLTVETANMVLDQFYTRKHQYIPSGSYVMLAVSDTGCGMDEQTAAKIFDPFFTMKEKGTGLGLSTVYGIVKQSGGYINVYSEPGMGTTFKIYFPRVEEKVTEILKPVLPRPEELRGSETILLVEDENLVRQMVREILVHYGYNVLEACNGDEALGLCSRHAGTVHLMITDVVMPGMSGMEVSQKLASLRPGMKVLYMSGYTSNVILHQGILDSGVAFIQKPFTIASLAHKVREMLESGG